MLFFTGLADRLFGGGPFLCPCLGEFAENFRGLQPFVSLIRQLLVGPGQLFRRSIHARIFLKRCHPRRFVWSAIRALMRPTLELGHQFPGGIDFKKDLVVKRCHVP